MEFLRPAARSMASAAPRGSSYQDIWPNHDFQLVSMISQAITSPQGAAMPVGRAKAKLVPCTIEFTTTWPPLFAPTPIDPGIVAIKRSASDLMHP